MATLPDTKPEAEPPTKRVKLDWREMLCKDLYTLQQSGILCDISLQSAEDTVPAHRVILATRVPYFRAMFTCTLGADEVHTASLVQFKKTTVGNVENPGTEYIVPIPCSATVF